MKNYQKAIFDFDGTLVKPIPLNWKRVKKTIDRMGLKEGLSLTHLNPVSEKLACAFGYSPVLRKKILSFIAGEEMKIASKVKLHQLGFRLLRKALAADLPILILSNNSAALIQRVLKREGIRISGLKIISVDRMPIPKPHLFFVKKLKRFFSNRKRILFVGNSETDRMVALSLKIDFKNVSPQR